MLSATGAALASVSCVDNVAAAAGGFALAGCCTGPLFAALLTGHDRYAPPTTRTQVFTLAASIKSTFAAGGAALAGGWQSAGSGSLVFAVAGCQVVAAVLGALAEGTKGHGNAVLLLALGQHLEQQLSAPAVQLHIAQLINTGRSTRP
jgi:hypothetical protein